MNKNFQDINGFPTTGKWYEFEADSHKMILQVVKCEYTQLVPASSGSGFFGVAEPEHTETVSGFIGGLWIDGSPANGFKVSGDIEVGDILETNINGKYHCFNLSDKIASELAADGNIQIFTANWEELK